MNGSGPSPHVLREYCLLADDRRGALVGPHGDICWLCAPAWDSDAVCAALIGGAGSYSVTPAHPFVWGGNYEPRTLIWRARWVTRRGVVVCRDALAYPGRAHTVVILRRIEPVPGDVTIRVALDIAPGFGADRLHDFRREGDGAWSARAGGFYVRLSGSGTAKLAPGRLGAAGHVLAGDISLTKGSGCDLVLEIADRPFTAAPPAPDSAWRATEYAWIDAVPAVAGTLADRDATTSRAVLRGMTDPGGGMVAAATMSLPERAEEGRNYDYRYVWVRDQSITGQAAAAIGATDLLDAAVSFVGDRMLTDGAHLHPAYGVGGGAVPDEHTVDIPGYPGGFDVAGNHVNEQFQLDSFGEALMLFAAAARTDRMAADAWRAAEIAADVIADHWLEPDAGIWELDNRVWTESRLICAVGLQELCRAGAPTRRIAQWESLADTIFADTARRCVNAAGWWQRGPADARADAALLLPVMRGRWTADDPLAAATVAEIERELTEDFFVYRFRHRPGPLAQAEGAFLLCGFAMSVAKAQMGDVVGAMRYFERARTACGPPGLFSEEYDVDEKQMRGNLPQAFVHAAFLESAARLAAH